MRTHEQLKIFVRLICADEADVLMDLLPSLIKSKRSNQKIIKKERQSICCTKCVSTTIIKNGKTKKKRQRYYCNVCRKSFSDNNNSIVFKSINTYELWIQFIDCELHNYTLKDAATSVDVIQTTVFT